MNRSELTEDDLKYVTDTRNNGAAGVNDDIQLDIWQRPGDTLVGVLDKKTGKHTGEFWKYAGQPDALDIQAEYIEATKPPVGDDDPDKDAGDVEAATVGSSEAGEADEKSATAANS